ncbi:tectonic-1 [Ambystoma mexicanum]|uniref:tectonic-1 n=1 Tax=Ambystoma mexicanum TaxID=8296 RepID=UPI0037E7F1FF
MMAQLWHSMSVLLYFYAVALPLPGIGTQSTSAGLPGIGTQSTSAGLEEEAGPTAGTSVSDRGETQTAEVASLPHPTRVSRVSSSPDPTLHTGAASPRDFTLEPGSSAFPPLIRAGPNSPRAAVTALPSPVTDVQTLCVCNLLAGQCDVNCCCDPDCTASDFSVFSTCSVPVVAEDSQLCSQRVVLYSMNMSKVVPERVVQFVDQVNPSIFCLQATNYKPALNFDSPEVPTESNFDSLVLKFKTLSFNADTGGSSATSNAGRYEYGAPVQTNQSFLVLPAPLVSSKCTDQNPAGFLMNEHVKCSRNIKMENCSNAALDLSTYYNVHILEAPNSSQTVPINVQSIIMTSLDGTFNRINITYPKPEYNANVCKNVVLKVSYLITYTEEGLITKANVSFVLGAINSSMVPLQQTFQIRFIQENTNPVPLSGNPGYIAGQPVMAGFKPAGSGIIQSTNRYGQLTILQSSTNQDCLATEGKRSAVLFGYNMVSGCKFRNSVSNCQLMGDTILKVLRGENSPEYVASFGNSQAQNVADWVLINWSTSGKDPCQVPVSSEIVVNWKKYGSLVNPQAKIESVTETMTYVTVEPGNGNIYQISSLVTFVDISASAQAGYRAQPTIDAKLPFDFFYPFV